MLGGEMANRNTHVWKHVNADGEKREVRAEKFGGRWRIQARLKSETSWTYYDVPELEDLVALRQTLWNKYQRKHLAFEDLQAVEQLITDRGGTWEQPEEDEEAGTV